MSLLLSAVLLAAALGSVGEVNAEAAVLPARTVKVLPIFFVPEGAAPPTEKQAKDFMRHVEWARKRYAELLPGHVTFGVAAKKPLVVQGSQKLEYYRARPDWGAPDYAAELLAHLKCTRFNCPYVMLVLVMNPVDDYPGGLGQPVNGGFNTGGSIVLLPSSGLDKYPILQSSMQHELGHGFGLPHVDVFGYDMRNNESLMSYNAKHHTNGFTPSPTPGKFIPEDIRALALNHRVFPKLRFDPDKDVPKGYKISKRVIGLGRMNITGLPDGVQVSTKSGEEDGCTADRILIGPLTPVEKGVTPEFDPDTMWRSGKTPTGWVSIQVTLPAEVALTKFLLHTMPPGHPEAVRKVRASVLEPDGSYRVVAEKDVKTADDTLAVRKTRATVWRFEFQTDPGKAVLIRGLEFFSGSAQIFPPLLPFQAIGEIRSR
jgi:hypothetical protein